MARTSAALAILALSALSAGCVASGAGGTGLACQGQSWTETRLFLGRGHSGGGEASEAQWREFVDAEVTTRLRDGFTVLDGVGFWRDPATDRSAMETSKVLVVLHPRTAAFDGSLEAVSRLYLARFGQSAVLRADQPVCVTLHSASAAPARSP